MALKKIDFTSGIRSENIQYNFEYLQNDLNKNRLFTIGYGIADGLEIKIDPQNFKFSVSDGFIVDDTGAMIAISGINYTVDLQADILHKIFHNHIVDDSKVTFIDVPYASNGKHQLYLEESGYDWRKDVSFHSLLGTEITSVDFIGEKTFYLDGIENGSVVDVEYYVAKDIVYTIYINTNHEIQICKSISSTSPSEYQLSDFLYKLGNVFVRSYINGYTIMEFDPDMTYRINIYTDSSNELYIGGKKFSNMRHIYTYRPDAPELHDIWYNSDFGQNRFYVYKEIDGELLWIPVGDYCFSAAFTNKFWDPSDEAAYNETTMDPKYFIFDAAEQEMYFEPDANALSVIVDNAPLHMDQFTEVTLSELVSIIKTQPTSNIASVVLKLGYTEDFINSLLYEIDSDGNIIKSKPDICIGFKMTEPFVYNFEGDEHYKVGPYVEAITSHLFNVPAQTYKIQKTTSFVNENHYIYNSALYADRVFTTTHTYKVGQHQLEVYLNGIRLVCSVDYVEQSGESRRSSSSFKILKPLTDGDVISYRINAVCYSYDNDFCNSLPKGYYNFIIKRTDDESDILVIPNEYNVREFDFISIYTMSNRNILIRKDANIPDDVVADYEIIRDENGRAYIHILNDPIVPVNDSLYVTGLKFSDKMYE